MMEVVMEDLTGLGLLLQVEAPSLIILHGIMDLLELERKAFLELCYEKKTLERIQSLLQKGKILRN